MWQQFEFESKNADIRYYILADGPEAAETVFCGVCEENEQDRSRFEPGRAMHPSMCILGPFASVMDDDWYQHEQDEPARPVALFNADGSINCGGVGGVS